MCHLPHRTRSTSNRETRLGHTRRSCIVHLDTSPHTSHLLLPPNRSPPDTKGQFGPHHGETRSAAPLHPALEGGSRVAHTTGYPHSQMNPATVIIHPFHQALPLSHSFRNCMHLPHRTHRSLPCLVPRPMRAMHIAPSSAGPLDSMKVSHFMFWMAPRHAPVGARKRLKGAERGKGARDHPRELTATAVI